MLIGYRLLALGFLAAVLPCALGCSGDPLLPPFSPTAAPADSLRAHEVVFVSDTQAPLWVETLALQEDHNREATARLLQDIGTLKPASVFMLGDVVNLGFDESEWRFMGTLIDRLRSEGIPVHAILGNHDVMFDAAAGEAEFQQRFPSHRRTGYVRIVDSLAVVLLNSNFGTMDDVALDSQQQWYEQTMTDLARDPGIVAIVVTCHHSPFSNSILVGSSVQSQERFVTRFLAEPKARLFMSGHAHTFEHFRREGKDFLTIGGGGGLQHPLYTGSEQKHADLSPTHVKPKFHYTVVRRSGQHLEVTVRRLEADKSRTADYYAFGIPLRDEQKQ
jgi:3',5'-cyclic AMP phosphodiesterase CpdA